MDRPAGTIERRRDFVFIDVDGVQHEGYSSLADAKAAAERPTGPWPTPRPMPWYATSRARLVGVAGIAGITTSLMAVMSAIVAQRISF